MRCYRCDGCFNDIEPGDPNIGLDCFPGWSDDEDDEDDTDPADDGEYQYHFHSWACVWVKAGREVEELPSNPLG